MSDDWNCPECEYSGTREEVWGHVRGRTDDSHDDVEPERLDADTSDDEPEDDDATEGASEGPLEGGTDPQEQVIESVVSDSDATDDEPGDSDATEGPSEAPSEAPGVGLPWKRVALGLVALGAAVVVSGSKNDDTIDVEGTVESTEPATDADDSDASDASEAVATRGLS